MTALHAPCDSTSAGDAYEHLEFACRRAIETVARRRVDVAPGLLEYIQDHVVFVVGGTTRRALGWYGCGFWRHGERRFDEIFVKADADRRIARPGVSPGEDVLITLIHEAAHAFNTIRGVKDCSNRGRYHNRAFGEIALHLGLHVKPHATFGHETPDLQDAARVEFIDLIELLEEAVVLERDPVLTTPGSIGAASTGTSGVLSGGTPDRKPPRYVFARCKCVTALGDPVTFRMARGFWREEVPIICTACGSPFGVSTTSG